MNLRQGEAIRIVTPTPKAFIEINVVGSVNVPGVYQLKPNQRVYDAIESAGGASETADLSRLNLAALLEDGQRLFVPSFLTTTKSSDQITPENPLSLNDATLEQLITLPGIGEKKAQAIIEFRDNFGIFSTLDQLLQVEGINQSLFDEIKPLLSVDP